MYCCLPLVASGISMHCSSHNSILLVIRTIHFSSKVMVMLLMFSQQLDLDIFKQSTFLQPLLQQHNYLMTILRKWSKSINLVVMAPKGMLWCLCCSLSKEFLIWCCCMKICLWLEARRGGEKPASYSHNCSFNKDAIQASTGGKATKWCLFYLFVIPL